MDKAQLRARRKQALRYARDQHKNGPSIWHNLCQKFARTALGAPGGAASARLAWLGLTDRQRRGENNRTPPAGVPVYFKLNTPYWHAAISAGKGYVWSTDIVRIGQVDKVSISYLERRWNAEYLGWATHINGHRVW